MKKRQTYTLEQSTIDLLKKVSEETDIPQSRIVEKAIIERCESLLKQ